MDLKNPHLNHDLIMSNRFTQAISINFKFCKHLKDFNFRYSLESVGKTEGF